MSWGLAADWFAVAGAALLTYGTGTQALANLAEFKSAKDTISDVVADAFNEQSSTVRLVVSNPALLILFALFLPFWIYLAFSFVFFIPKRITALRAKGGDEAIQLARFLRLVEVWSILALGAAGALVAACIQLALA